MVSGMLLSGTTVLSFSLRAGFVILFACRLNGSENRPKGCLRATKRGQ